MQRPDKDSGQGIIEYALILILAIIILYLIISLLGPAILEWINEFIESVRS